MTWLFLWLGASLLAGPTLTQHYLGVFLGICGWEFGKWLFRAIISPWLARREVARAICPHGCSWDDCPECRR